MRGKKREGEKKKMCTFCHTFVNEVDTTEKINAHPCDHRLVQSNMCPSITRVLSVIIGVGGI
jgi:hypothetical protein